MIFLLSALPLLMTNTTVPGQIDKICRGNLCQFLAVQQGMVRYIEQEPARNFVIRRYQSQVQPLVPKSEAAIRILRSSRGWQVAVSAFLDHAESAVGLRLRFIAPDHTARITEDVMYGLDLVKLNMPFGDGSEIFVITTEEEHSYNVSTEIWLLPEQGDPTPLAVVRGTIDHFVGPHPEDCRASLSDTRPTTVSTLRQRGGFPIFGNGIRGNTL
jgi:hypothetical protein